MRYCNAPAGDGQVSSLTFRLSSSIPNSNTQSDCVEAQIGRHPHSNYVNYFTHGNQRSYRPANLAPHCLMCMHTHIHNTHSQSSWQPLAHIKVGLLVKILGVSVVDHTCPLLFKHPSSVECSDQVCQQSHGSEKSPSVCVGR